VYWSTREEELTVVSWDEAVKRAFVEQQFEAQDAYWREHYRDTSFDVILAGGEPAGRLYVARWEEEIRIVDIALLPAFRGRGVGTALLRDLMAEADEAGKRLSIHVEMNNPARSLYDRLGFAPAGTHGVYVLMERAPVS
jgi:ribosomal protein S18 acetylase RimI-like enzyme